MTELVKNRKTKKVFDKDSKNGWFYICDLMYLPLNKWNKIYSLSYLIFWNFNNYF